MTVSSTAYIVNHLKKAHSIDPSTGCLMPKVPVLRPDSPFTTAAHVPGSSAITSYIPWEEDSFQAAVVDWTISRDLSFVDVTNASTQGLLT